MKINIRLKFIGEASVFISSRKICTSIVNKNKKY